MPDNPNQARKRCSRCRGVKPVSEFYPRRGSKRTPDLVGAYCKECTKEAVRAHYILNREEVLARGKRHRLLRRYGLTVEAYERLWEQARGQSNMSGVPLARTAGLSDSVHVDHFHDLNGLPVVRGLITARENQAIGLLGHDPELCIAAAQYLLRSQLDLRELCAT